MANASQEQIQELIDNCSSQWTTLNGVNGCLITGVNGKFLFLPAAGGYSTLHYNIGYDCTGWSRVLNSGTQDHAYHMDYAEGQWYSPFIDYRSHGHPVRPVRSTEPAVTAAPVITYDIQDDEAIISATGDGEVLLYINGVTRENPCVYPRGNTDVTLTVVATAQESGKEMSTSTMEILVPAKAYTPEEESFTANGITFKMITVDGGSFTMGNSTGDNEEKPEHQVTLSTYKIGKIEVTQALWQAVMGSNPSHFTGNVQRPVETVSWYDCQAFILKLNQLTGKQFRLPTEAEWEFAARGGNRSQGYKYAGSNTLGNVAWCGLNSGSMTHPVNTKSSNELGVYDMSGNVLEWCQDWYGSYTSVSQTNPTGASSGTNYVIRGGSWSDDDWRITMRSYEEPEGLIVI